MIQPTTVSNGKLTTDTTSTNLVFNRMNQDYSIKAMCETFIEYNMNEYGETPTETVSVSNYDLETEATITGIAATGAVITYTANNTFSVGDTVSIIGVNPSQFNLKDVVVASATSSYFTVSSLITGTYSSGGKASKKSDYYPVENVVGLPFKKLFPIDTIKEPFRPNSSGIKYAILGDLKKEGTTPNYSDPKALEYGYQMTSKHRVYYPGEDTYYKYWVGGRGKGIDLRLKYPKTILTNKIVVKFELSHSTPATFNIYLSNSTTPIFSGVNTDIPYTTANEGVNKGVFELYYNGSTWTKDYVWSAAAPVSTTDIRVTATKETGSTDKFIGIIEVSPVWRKQILDEIVSCSITKDSSSGSEDYLPVGRISANSLQLNLFSPAALASEYVKAFDKSQTLNQSTLYFSKNMVIKPFITLSEITGSELLIAKQGTFYLDSWTINEYGEIAISARDGAKYLQEISAAPVLCKNYTVPGIIRYLLDSIGFTNYKFNFRRVDPTYGSVTTDYGTISESSTITPHYWWTDSNKTVWNALGELCRDSQLTAFFDEENVLQFYTKDALFDPNRKAYPQDSSSVMWEFRNTTESNTPIQITGATTNMPDPPPNHPATVNDFKYIYAANNNFKQGDIVTVTGVVNNIYNISGVVISANSTTFTLYSNGASTGTNSKISSPFPNLLWGGGGTVVKTPDLANIISLEKTEQRATNKVKVVYYSTYGSEMDLEQSKQNLWDSQGAKNIGAGVLRTNLLSSQSAGFFVELDPVKDSSLIPEAVMSYNGYLTLNSEIIEFDGVEYEYYSADTGNKETVLIQSKSDLEQIISIAKPEVGKNNIQPNGRYRIKERGSFGTTPQDHLIDVSAILNSWNIVGVTWK